MVASAFNPCPYKPDAASEITSQLPPNTLAMEQKGHVTAVMEISCKENVHQEIIVWDIGSLSKARADTNVKSVATFSAEWPL